VGGKGRTSIGSETPKRGKRGTRKLSTYLTEKKGKKEREKKVRPSLPGLVGQTSKKGLNVIYLSQKKREERDHHLEREGKNLLPR